MPTRTTRPASCRWRRSASAARPSPCATGPVGASSRTGPRSASPRSHGGWNATSYYTGSAVQSVEPGSTLTLQFADARVSGDGGCNTFDGGYRVQGVDRIHIGPLALRACADPALNDQETRYLAALQLAVRYRVTGRSLTLYRPGGTIATTFERATGLTSGS